MRRYLPPILATVAILAIAPFIREVQALIFRLLPERGVAVLTAALLALLLASLVFALRRIRDRRAWRYGGLALVLVLLYLQVRGFSQDGPDADLWARVNVSERMHIVEYGLLAVLLVRAFRPFGGAPALLLPMLWVLVAGTLDEWVQWLVPTRTGEIRDVAMNVVAGATGTLFGVCLWPPGKAARARRGWRLVARGAALAVAVLGGFVSVAHLGYEIVDAELGRFRSWHSPAALRAAAVDRAVAWDVPNPPTGREIWALQDPYLEEAARHAQHRNESFQAGNYVLAWHAHRILERYYAPYLDKRLPNGGRQRLAPHVRAKIEAEGAPGDPESYLSPVLRERIWIRPRKAPFLLAVGLVSALLWLLPAFFARAPPSR